MSRYFFSTNQIIQSTLPKGSLSEKIKYLRTHYTSPELLKEAQDVLMQRYISDFNYDRNYAAGLQEIQQVTSTYVLDQQYVQQFKARHYARKGAPFPEEIHLVDTLGNTVSFNRFKGYYVYIDLWASWCGPCCREVPYLQQLEKTLQNPKVKFVSISLDSSVAAWKKKRTALQMTGNQFLESEGKLGEALNIRGIPHFLIYDPQGKLLHYDAPRPSQGEQLKRLLEKLQ